MKLTDQLTDYVHAAFTRPVGADPRARRGRARDRPARPPAEVEGRRLGRRQRPAPARLPRHRCARRRPRRPPRRPPRPARLWPSRNGTALLLLHNFHKFWNNPEVVQTAFAQLVAGKQQRTFLVVLSPVVQIPVELEKLFVVLEHALPDREGLERIARELTSDSPDDLPAGRRPPAGARRRGGPDALRGRGGLRPVADPPQRHPARSRLGAQGPGAQEEQPAHPAPGRRALRRPGRPGQPQGLLPPRPAAGPAASSRAASCSWARRARARVPLRRRWATRRAGPRCCWTWGRSWAAWSARRRRNVRQALQSPTPWRRASCSWTSWRRP